MPNARHTFVKVTIGPDVAPITVRVANPASDEHAIARAIARVQATNNFQARLMMAPRSGWNWSGSIIRREGQS